MLPREFDGGPCLLRPWRRSDREALLLHADDRIGGSLPELYVMVYDSEGRCVLSTRAHATPNAAPDLLRVPIPRDLARQHGLI